MKQTKTVKVTIFDYKDYCLHTYLPEDVEHVTVLNSGGVQIDLKNKQTVVYGPAYRYKVECKC